MNVSASTLERALLSIYHSMGLHAGGTLSIAALQRAWNQTGLRNSDFRDAVRILLGRGFLQVRDLPDAMEVALTGNGEARMVTEEFRHPSRPEEVEDVETLSILRSRVMARHHGWDGSRRRQEDDFQELSAVRH